MSLAKARIISETGEELEALFNPSEFTVRKSVQWKAAEAKGKNTPQLRFQQGQSGTLRMKLVFDTTHSGEDVTSYTGRLLRLTEVDPDLPGSDQARNKARPPWVRFHWGHLHSFKAIVEKLKLSFTYFASDGTPLRATADVTLKQYEDERAWGPQNPTSGTPTPHTVHRVQSGETLDRIAALYYGDPTRWRSIARANRVADPLALGPGTDLIIPEPELTHRG